MTADGDFRLDEAVAVLERTPRVLRAMLEGLPDRWLHATEGEGTWSPFDVIGHLAHAELTNWLPRARHILAGGEHPFPSFDRFAHLTRDADATIDERLDTFAGLRAENLTTLQGMRLTRTDLETEGRHPELGAVRLRELLATWVVHDLDHLGQIARVMAKSYRHSVGPWSAFLSILRDRE